MQGKTHALTGLLLGVIIVKAIAEDPLLKIGVLVASITGALLPDIDTASSIFGKKVKLVGWLSRHRGFFHSLLFLLLILIILSPFLPTIIVIAFSIGFLSHLLLDGLTKKGVTLIPKILHIKGPLKTGRTTEKLLFITEIALLAYIIVI